jgi:tyrosine-protein phosphatase SIW14
MVKTAILVLVLAISNSAFAIDNFMEVKEGVYRGARPGIDGLKTLKSLGVKTIVNLDDDYDAIAEEDEEARRLGINMVSIPISSYWYPKDEQVNEALLMLNDQNYYPLFVHCMHGEDRTGLIVGLYRVEFQNWTAKKAWREMKEMNFHSILFLLKQYFEDRTGVDL